MDHLATPRAPIQAMSDSTPITDFALIESQKENIRPHAAGRSAATLSNLFAKSEADRVIQEGHAQHMKDVEEAERRDREGEDMVDGFVDLLDVYGRYITFTVQHHPSSDNSHLLPLLESTNRRFIDDGRYAQDIRYLKLWIQYARHVERREEIFSMLGSREIGTKHALFYEEWATALEGLGRKKQADGIYQLGIHRKAAPLERLKSRHAAYRQRIMVPLGTDITEDDPVSAAPRLASRAPRLGTSTGSLAGAVQLAPSTRVARPHNGSKMEIFSDASAGGGQDDPAGPWEEFGTRDGRRKENTLEAKPWAGETMPQKRSMPRTPKMEVFRDVGDNDAVRATPADEVFSRARSQTSEAEMLRHDPLRFFDTSNIPVGIPALPAPPAARKAPKPSKPSQTISAINWECPKDGPEVKDAKGKTQRRMFDWDAVFKGGEEWSFEEVRARQRGLLGKEWKGEVKDWERQWHAAGSSTPKPAEKKRTRLPSPTVNTKLANEEVAMMFDQTIHGGKIRDSDSESDDESGSSDEEDQDAVAIPPTPLPAPGAMMRPVAGMVPPTPTPAQGLGKIYADENANAPLAAAKKFNVFSETPAKTPLAARTPLASSSKPRAFGVFSDEVDSTPSVKSRPPLGSVNIFATPVLGEKVATERRVFEDVIPEEPEEGEEESVGPISAGPHESAVPPNVFAPVQPVFDQQPDAPEHAPIASESISEPAANATAESSRPSATPRNIFATPALREKVPVRRPLAAFTEEAEEDEGEEAGVQDEVVLEEFVNINDEEDLEEPYRPQRGGRFQPAEMMTPIAERTCEFTQMSALRSSTNTASSRRISSASSLGVPDEAEEAEAAPSSLSAVAEEADEGSSSARQQSAHATPRSSMGSTFYSPAHRSGSVTGAGFGLPEGYTIPPRAIPDEAHTMGVESDTMHTAREGSVDRDTEAFVTAQHGPGRIPNPCNPIDDAVLAELLEVIDPPLADLPGFQDFRTSTFDGLDALQKHGKSRLRRSSGSGSRVSIAPEEGYALDLFGKEYEVREKIGEGGYGAVFLGIDVEARQAMDDLDDDDSDIDEDEAEAKCVVAIKVEKPAAVWEAVVLDRMHRRLDDKLRSSIIAARGLYAFEDESYLLLDYHAQGTLLDVVNKASSMGIAPATAGAPSAVDELVAVFFTIELLRLVEGLHRANFIHGDLKIDNCLVRLQDLPNASWSPQYAASGADGWSAKGVKLIDFGRAIDLSLFPDNGRDQQFIADWKVDERDCVEMREGRPWSFQTDYFGLASICYCLLYGKYIGTECVGGRYKIDQPLRRYWQGDLWNALFDLLLNSTTVRGGALPISDELAEVRGKFESWLEENCQKGGKNLRSMLKKIELMAITSKKLP